MKSYNPASSRSWANSSGRDFRKEIENCQDFCDYVNSRTEYVRGECMSKSKITTIESTRLLRKSRQYTEKLLKSLRLQSLIIGIRTGQAAKNLTYFKKPGHVLTPDQVKEASTY